MKACSKGRKAIETHFGNMPLTVHKSHEKQESGNRSYFIKENYFPKRKISNDRSLEESKKHIYLCSWGKARGLFKPFLEERLVFY